MPIGRLIMLSKRADTGLLASPLTRKTERVMPYILHHNEMLRDDDNGKWWSVAEVKDLLNAIDIYKRELPQLRTQLSKIMDQKKSNDKRLAGLENEVQSLADQLARARNDMASLEERHRGIDPVTGDM